MKHVLVVDDAVTVRMYHRDLMEALSLEVEEAENGIEALEKALTKRFDLMIVDVNMPKMDGYRFVSELRQQEENPDVPVIMVSTEAEEQDRIKALSCGANFYVVKPAKVEELQSIAQMLVGA